MESLGPGELTAILGGGVPEIGDGGLLESPATGIGLGSLVADSAGNVFIGERARVRRIDAATGIVTTVAGNGIPEYSGDGGPAVAAGLDVAGAIVIVEGDLVFLTRDSEGERVFRRVDLDTGLITSIPRPYSLRPLISVAVTASGHLLASFSDPVTGLVSSIERIDVESGARTVLWSGVACDVAPGKLMAASDSVVLMGGGVVSSEIWRIDLASGDARRVAGGGETPLSREPVAALDASISLLSDFVIAPDGSILVSTGSLYGVPA